MTGKQLNFRCHEEQDILTHRGLNEMHAENGSKEAQGNNEEGKSLKNWWGVLRSF
jgi:hypothetical protein